MTHMRKTMILAIGAAALLAVGPALAGENAKEGKKVFNRCKACHSLKAGENRVGPSLHDVVGRKAGTAEGYHYDKDMLAARDKGLVWTEDNLVDYLKDPSKFIGNYIGKDKARVKMTFRLPKENERKAVVEYLKEAEE